mmetsp:Transcript_16761/g.20163  ORF Transcript_16761/g.20163 Transcript_16761/m.20163 type:complete len:88 (-) Transcript_16761:207-470(-)
MKHVDDDEAGLLLESCFSDKNINDLYNYLMSGGYRVEKLDFMKSMPTFQYGDRQTYLWALDTVQSLVADKMKSSRTEPHMSTARCPA